jgi:hypothetical protein
VVTGLEVQCKDVHGLAILLPSYSCGPFYKTSYYLSGLQDFELPLSLGFVLEVPTFEMGLMQIQVDHETIMHCMQDSM